MQRRREAPPRPLGDERGDDLCVLHGADPTGPSTLRVIDPAFCYVTTTGRRTGRPHTIEIWFARSGSTLYVLAGGRERADWVRNLVADPAVRVRVGDGDQVDARARVLEAGTDEDDLARRLVVEKYQAPDATDLESWGRSALAVAFDLAPPSAG